MYFFNKWSRFIAKKLYAKNEDQIHYFLINLHVISMAPKNKEKGLFLHQFVCVYMGQSALFGIFPKTRSSSLHAILWVVGLGRCSLNERFSSLGSEILVATFDKPNGHRIRAPFYMRPRLSLGLMFKVINNIRIINPKP
jgi:hypothetical protein